MRAGACYQAARVNQLAHGWEYVEGLLIIHIAGRVVAVPHAWNVDAGCIVDQTRRDLAGVDRVEYRPVRWGTTLTVAELDHRGDPDDLIGLARSM